MRSVIPSKDTKLNKHCLKIEEAILLSAKNNSHLSELRHQNIPKHMFIAKVESNELLA